MTGPATPARPDGPPTWPDIAERAARQRAALREAAARFERLDARQRSLGMARAVGVTADHWRPAEHGLRAAGSLLATWHDRLAAADGHLGRGRDRGSLARVSQLLYGVTIELSPAQLPMAEHRPPTADSTAPRYSLAQVTEFVDGSLRTVESVLDAVAEIRAAAERISALRQACDAAAGGPAGEPADRAAADAIADRAPSDPLAVAPEAAADLDVRFARCRCAQLASAINTLEAAEGDFRRAVARREGLAGLPLPQAAAGLHEELTELRRRGERERRSDPAALADLADRVARAGERLRPGGPPRCARPDCPGGALDPTGICTTCFRAPRRGEGG